ncbi:hypothetical protein [Flavobacterium dankookense]|uniref:Uncharacterized protein n=1 Tax=Flavobacterium dankookense TaxID=706186 RepID=A0A4V3CSC7_9FLAO|nr:hypothetical protein [Flavobacterium dankookense]TDP60162.1 hypothetical protein BC748_1141 [Flavobacterium dankookense]
MNILENLKYVHILAGSLTLICGTIAMFSKKGQKNHRLAGKIFFWAMAVTTALGLNAGIFKPGYEIFIPIAIISFYQVASGYRILYIKTLHKGQKAQIVDWILAIGMFVTSNVFIYMGIVNISIDIFYSIVLFSFATIGLYCSIVDIYHFTKKPTNKSYWLFIHIFRMSHAFIAALTAFLVNNSKLFPFLPQVLLLIIPIAIGQPIITYTIWSYRKKMAKVALINKTVKLDQSFTD